MRFLEKKDVNKKISHQKEIFIEMRGEYILSFQVKQDTSSIKIKKKLWPDDIWLKLEAYIYNLIEENLF